MTDKNPSFVEIHPYIYRLSLSFMSDSARSPGPVNIYLLTGNPVTLIDTGTVGMAPMIHNALSELNLLPSDIEQIVITHGHLDHYGGAYTLKQSAPNLVVAAHKDDVDLIEGRTSIHSSLKYPFLTLAGYPMLWKVPLRLLDRRARKNFLSCSVTRQLEDGDVIKCGYYDAEIVWTPGHSKGSVCIYLKNENILFSGDTIISNVTPNAIVMLERDGNLPIRKSQAEFYSSLAKLEKMNPALICSGHGESIDNINTVTEYYRKLFNKRRARILERVINAEQTIYEIAVAVFPIKATSKIDASFEIFLAISEVYTHLQVLEQEGKVKLTKRGGKLYVTLL